MKILKYGCLGCLGLVVLAVVIGLAVAGVAWMQVQNEEVAEQQLTPRLPVTGDADAADHGYTGRPAPKEPGKVVLDLRNGGFSIRPTEPGEKLHIEAEYDKNGYSLVEQLEEGPGDGWTYTVRFHRTGSGLASALKQLFGGSQPQVHVFLPPDIPIELQLQIEQGGAEIELGGLWLTSAEFELSQGGVELEISEPLHSPMRRMSIRHSMGGLSARNIGNASPAVLDVEFSMGGMELDLRGQWVDDSQITISGSMGGGAVRVPRNVRLLGLDNTIQGSLQDELQGPTLTFSVTSSMGEVEFY